MVKPMKKETVRKRFGILLALVLLFTGLFSSVSFSVFAVTTSQGSTDKSVLEALTEQAKTLNTNGCSAESTAFFEAALSLAEEVLGQEDASQQDIDKQVLLLQASASSLLEKESADIIYNGTYTIDGILQNATADQASMGNAALVKPMELIVTEEGANLKMEFVPLTTKLGAAKFTGYLAEFYYFPDWEGGKSGYALPTDEIPEDVTVESRYEEVYDSYNHPKTGTDSRVKGKLYPHYVTMPVTLGDGEIWVQVYVPVMEEISTGGGLQYAKLLLDWDSRKQVSGTQTDKQVLQKRIKEAEAFLTAFAKDTQGYSQTHINMLQAAVTAATAVNASINVDQTAVDAMAKALLMANNVFREGAGETDKTELKRVIDTADSYLNTKNSPYSEIQLTILKNARDNAKAVYDNSQATQQEIDEQVELLQYAIDNLQSGTSTTVDKSGLHTMLLAATSSAGRDCYTEATINKLKKAIKTAEAVYQKKDATQEEVDEQTSALAAAIIALKQKDTQETPGGGNEGNENPGGGNEGTLDIKNLKDGIYSITGTMVKIDKTTASMSDEAIGHTIKLTVKDGAYAVTLNFKGLAVGNQFGYLSELKYFTTGYSTDSYGAPSGKLEAVTVDSYQENEDGTRVSDSLGTDYPKQVTFPLISEALKDGYVPLQVFVPIMDSISAGSGTQAVYLKLDLDSVKAETDENAFQNDDGNQDNGGNAGTNTNSLLNQSNALSGQSTLKGASSLKKGTSLLSGNESLSRGSSLFGNTIDETSAGLSTAEEKTERIAENSGTAVTGTTSTGSKPADRTQAVPAVMSFLAAAAGVIYKVSSRRVFAG